MEEHLSYPSFWRLVARGWATIDDQDTLSLDDVDLALIYLDAIEEAEAELRARES